MCFALSLFVLSSKVSQICSFFFYESGHLLGSMGKVTAPNHNPTHLGYMLQVVTLKGASRVLWMTYCRNINNLNDHLQETIAKFCFITIQMYLIYLHKLVENITLI